MRPILGISFKILSALAFILMSALVKHLGDRYPAGQLVFFRSAFALVPLVVWLAMQGQFPAAMKTRNVGGHITRGLIGTAGMFSNFIALSYLPLTDAVAIGYAAPLIVVIFAALILRENVRIYRWSAVVIGFAGILVMLSPHLGLLTPSATRTSAIGIAFALTGAVCTAGATIQVRRLTASETTGAIVFYFTLLTTLIGLATILLGWNMPTQLDALALVSTGILGGIGQILMTQGFRYGDASLVAPFEYSSMIWAILLGWFVFAELPTLTVLMGAAIVILSGLFVIWRERQLGIERRKAAEASLPRST